MPAPDARTLGQFFTPPNLVERMLKLKKRKGRTLEPSCGDGAFARHLQGKNLVALEFDAKHCPPYAKNMDFFAYPVGRTFDTVIGNPPYVRHQDIIASTRKLLPSGFSRNANLYLFFIQRSIRHLSPDGELIFVVPREFATARSAERLHRWMWKLGHYTHFENIGDTVFGDACLPCVVFRWQKTKHNGTVRLNDGRYVHLVDGRLQFTDTQDVVPLSNFFTVKVGGVSGADDLFTHPKGNVQVVVSETRRTGDTRRMLAGETVKRWYSGRHDIVTKLCQRGIRQFTKDNWWEWGRMWHQSDLPRIYVNCRTRNEQPFFIHECTAYDGSVLALFPNDPSCNLTAWCEHLNLLDWAQMGFKSGGRYLFSAGALQACLLPPPVIGYD